MVSPTVASRHLGPAGPLAFAAPQAAWPRLRSDLQCTYAVDRRTGEPTATLSDPSRNLFFQLDWPSLEILRRWSLGSPETIIEDIHKTTPLTVEKDSVLALLKFFSENHLLAPHDSRTVARMVKELAMSRRAWIKNLLHQYLFFRLPLVQPDAWLNRWMGVAGLFFSSFFLWMSLAVLLLSGALLTQQIDVFWSTLVDTMTWEGLTAYAVTVLAIKVLHECGHAFAAKRYGCRVPVMGVAFVVLWPMAYTDTNDVWRLKDPRQRLAVSSAGIVTELLVAIWASFAWLLLPDGALREAAFFLATTSWVLTVLINASPFMRFDGYFIVSDFLDMPNLHARSFAMAKWKLREWLFRLGDPCPEDFEPTARRAMILFAWATWIYRLVVFLGIALLVYYFFFKLLGIVLFIIEIYWFIVHPIAKELGVWATRFDDIRTSNASTRRVSGWLLLVLLLLTLLFIPLPARVTSVGLVKPPQTMTLYAPSGAQLNELGIKENQEVRQGDPLVALWSPELEARWQRVFAKEERLRWMASAATLSATDIAQSQSRQEQWAEAVAEKKATEEEIALLRPTAPFDGVIRDLTPDLRLGQWLAPKERIAVLVAQGPLVVETYIYESDVEAIQPGDSAFFTPHSANGPSLRLRVVTIDPDPAKTLPASFDSRTGGHISTRQQGSTIIPEASVYRVQLTVESVAQHEESLRNHQWRGDLVIHGAPRSAGMYYIQNAAAVLIRESGW